MTGSFCFWSFLSACKGEVDLKILDGATNCLRLLGADPFTALKVKRQILKSIRYRTGKQYTLESDGMICHNFGSLKALHAAVFCTR